MSPEATNVRHHLIPTGRGPAMGPFAVALRTGSGEATRFLPTPPSGEEGWRDLLARTAARTPAIPAGLAEDLANRQTLLGGGEQAAANARALGDADGPALAVVTGQQPGLLGGPLLTLHKIAGAIALAGRLDGLDGRRVVPVFWSATDDHDFEEANRALVLDRRGGTQSLRLEVQGDGRSIADVSWTAGERRRVLDALREALPDTPRGRAACDLAAFEQEDDFAAWSNRILLRILGDAGLVVVEPQVLAPHLGPSMAWLLERAEDIREAISTCRAELLAAGLPAPLDPKPGSTPLFLRRRPGGRRLRVDLAPDGEVLLRGAPSGIPRAKLASSLHVEPRLASGNVIGRVFLQNRHLPILAYVAGPTEIAYHAQVRAAHEAVGTRFPLALPRPEATWLDAKAEGALSAFGLDVESALAGAITARRPATGDRALTEGISALEKHLTDWPPALRALTEGSGEGAKALRRSLERIRNVWRRAEPAVRASFDADRGVGGARWARLQSLLRPLGRPQERVLSPLSLIARHGVEAFRQGLPSLEPLAPVHHVLRLGADRPPPGSR